MGYASVGKTKQQVRKYLIVETSCDNLSQTRLYTKEELYDQTFATDLFDIIDITTGKKYTLKKSVKLVAKK